MMIDILDEVTKKNTVNSFHREDKSRENRSKKLANEKKISVLFTQTKSIYNQLGTDNWDIKRDAKNWPGGNAIIAHPPCRAWGNYSNKAKPIPGERELAIWAIEQIRKWGGILEHPRTSRLWKEMKLPRPGEQPDQYEGFSISIDQYWFGHRGKKNTWLYIKGTTLQKLPIIPLKLGRATYKVEDMGKKERAATPRRLAEWLIKTAEIINNGNK